MAAAESEIRFKAACQRWLIEQLRTASNERKRRLEKGLGYSEKLFAYEVWWAAFGNFDNLHPEYEVRDFKDGVRFLDFAYINNGLHLCIEIDPYGTHNRNMSRRDHDDQLERQNDLIIDNWKVLRFSLDQVKDSPRKCQLKIQQGLGKWGIEQSGHSVSNPIDQAILAVMRQQNLAVSPIELSNRLGWHRSTISRHLAHLLKLGHIFPAQSGRSKITRYILNPTSSRTKI